MAACWRPATTPPGRRAADRQRQSRLYDGGAYLVQVSQTTRIGKTDVSGTAALAGTVQVVSPKTSYKFNQPYVILSAGGLGGTHFNSLTLPNFITGALSYTPTNAR